MITTLKQTLNITGYSVQCILSDYCKIFKSLRFKITMSYLYSSINCRKLIMKMMQAYRNEN